MLKQQVIKNQFQVLETYIVKKISLLSPQKIGNGALLNEVRQMRSQGAFKETGQVLDLAY